MQALQVLEVREQLERSVSGSDLDLTTPDMDDGEKALLREMCNVSYLDILDIAFLKIRLAFMSARNLSNNRLFFCL